jgi:putative two-component system response regulator
MDLSTQQNATNPQPVIGKGDATGLHGQIQSAHSELSLPPFATGCFTTSASVSSDFTVFVVDDDEMICDVMKAMLSAEGLNVITFIDGRACVEAAMSAEPDLVLLDVRLPTMDGFEVCRRIKAFPDSRFTPVVLVTGLSELKDRIRGIEVGADDFLTKPIDRHQLIARVKSLLALKSRIDELERAEAVLLTLARTIEAKDPYTEGHCERLAMWSSRLGRRIGLPPEQVGALWKAGIVHDIGKVAIPDTILLKPARLNPDEWLQVRKHPSIGEEICRPLKSFRAVLPVIRHHHEKLDGSGYPDGLKGDQIPLTARILQIVDVYDALVTHRPYKPALTREGALQQLQIEVEMGWWDGAVLENFRALLEEAGDDAALPERC